MFSSSFVPPSSCIWSYTVNFSAVVVSLIFNNHYLLNNSINLTSSYTLNLIIFTVTMSTPTSELVCEDGWILSPGKKCYYVSTTSEKTEWATAINRCRDMGAKLVEFKTDEEAQFVMRNLPERVSTISIVYTGRKSDDAGRWVFLSNDEGVDTSERSWSSGQPDGTQTCGCTRKSDDFLMLDCFCTGYHLFYICENLPTASTMTTPEPTTEPRNCYDGWITSPDKCYYVSTYSEKTEWATAISRCKSKGAILVEIKTDEESRFIMENLPSRVGSTDVVYTGRIRNDANIWVFVSNAEKVDATVRSWARGEPNGGSNQECGCTRTSDDFLMHDCFCTRNSLFYICEIER
ncbi:uncharacterized protein LOC117316155 isoform X1 [Pecten maximus]|uniref:uncharacterized protein LOC117316155 isoform X1 n=1 Tax=Pecten maximus TaxID=6579 RepID=UPI001458B0F7|nr:uncharacterized protein LOC117316155 isoform X1 [Pecten maximus]